MLSNANVTLARDANAAKPVLHFHGNEGRAVSVASGATGSLGVNGIALFTDSTDRNNNLTIGCALAVLGDVTFRGINIVPNQLAASFTITGKTTISADATVKTIDWGNTIFLGGIEVAKGVTAKIQTDPNGYAQIGAAVTLVANDGEGDSTTIWLMRSSNRSGKVSLVLGASVSVDADHAATHFIKTSSDEVTDENGLNPITCDVYEAARNPAVFVTTYGVTVSGVGDYGRSGPVSLHFAITRRPVTVTADNKSSRVNERVETLTASVTAGSLVGEGDLGTLSPFTATSGSDTPASVDFTKAGNYDILVSYTANPDYEVTVVKGTLTVRAAFSVSFFVLLPTQTVSSTRMTTIITALIVIIAAVLLFNCFIFFTFIFT